MSDKKLTVIVPVYNAGKYLVPALDSLVSSTHKNLDLILIDNGSTAEDGRICDLYAERDGRIRVLHTENRGVSWARNLGLEMAEGDYIGFMDSDDLIEPDIYEYMLNAAEQSGAQIVQCGVFKEYGDRTEIVNAPKNAVTVDSVADMNNAFWKDFSYTVWSKIYKSELARSIRFNTEYVIGEDLRYNLEALTKSKKTLLLPHPKYHYLQHPGSACYSAPTEENITSVRNMLKKSAVDFGGNENIRNFIFAENMRNNAHVTSRILLSGASGFDRLIEEIRGEVRENINPLWKCKGISTKEKLKLTLMAYAFGIYKRLLKALK